MSLARRKIEKPKGQEPDAFEEQVANALYELELSSTDLKADFRELAIASAKEYDFPGMSNKAVVIMVPCPLLKQFHKVQARLIRELEKKFSRSHVIIIANRKIQPKEAKNMRQHRQPRPRSRTLTAVHDSILEDLVFPTEIVGKRVRVKHDGSKLIKVHLDRKEQNNLENKIETLSRVYKQLTGKEVVFEFPEQD